MGEQPVIKKQVVEVQDYEVTEEEARVMGGKGLVFEEGAQAGQPAGERPPAPRAPQDPKAPGQALPGGKEEPQPGFGAADEEVFDLPEPGEAWPAWVREPFGFKVPAGRMLTAMVFDPEYLAGEVDEPRTGAPQCILWSLSDHETTMGYQRAKGVNERVLTELARGTIRVIDGVTVQWGGTRDTEGMGGIGKFWEAIGPAGRAMIQEWYANTHRFDRKKRVRFFGRCIATKRVG